MPEINIRIYPDGKIEAEVNGVKGKKCTNYIKILEELLEAKTFDSNYTKEYFELEEVKDRTENIQTIRNTD